MPDEIRPGGGERMLVIPASGADVLVLLPGFMIAASSYSVLARSVAEAGSTVIVPQLYRRGLGALAGRVPVAAEASSASALVRRLLAEKQGAQVHLGGHSRGGQAAWLAARQLATGGPPAVEDRRRVKAGRRARARRRTKTDRRVKAGRRARAWRRANAGWRR